MRGIWLWSLVLGACASEQTPPPAPPVTPPSIDAGATKPDAASVAQPAPTPIPITIPVVKGTRPGWWQPRSSGYSRDPFEMRDTESLGANAAVVSTKGHYLGVDRTNGVLGFVARTPGLRPRLVANDAVIVADQGRLVRYPSLADWIAKRNGNPLRIATKVDARWDAAGKHIVVATDNRVLVSRDGGKRFRTTRPFRDRARAISDIVVRPDGVAAIQTKAAGKKLRLFLSDRRYRWRASPFHPKWIARDGSWIHDADPDCSSVLSRDGKRWLNMNQGWSLGTPWTRLTQLRDEPRGRPHQNHPSARRPRPPQTSKNGVRTGRTKTCPKGSLGGMTGRGGMGRLGRPGLVAHLRGTITPTARANRWAFRFFDDGICTLDAGKSCVGRLPSARPPHVLLFDRGNRVPLATTKSPCAHVPAMRSVHGLGILVCKQAKGYGFHRYAPKSNAFVSEAQVEVPAPDIGDFGVASDGSMAMAFECAGNRCSAALRNPTNKTWTAAGTKNAIAYRVLPGARLLILTLESEAQGLARIGFALEDRSSKVRTLVTGVEIRSRLLRYRVDASGHIVLRMLQGKNAVSVKVGTKGELIPVAEGP